MEPRRTTETRLRIAVVYGTRPEAIKMAPVIRELRQRPARFEVTVCATGQHREMLSQVEQSLEIAPDIDLHLMQPRQSLNAFAARAFAALDPVLCALAPDWLLVQGDTTSAAVAALAAFHRKLRVGHVEAGLRSDDLEGPFPEEANRCIIDLVAAALFAPTAHAQQNLLRRGGDPGRVFVTGNTGIDALQWMTRRLPDDESQADEVLVTVHRRESFGAPLRGILGALRRLALRFPSLTWVYPVHPNPEVLAPAHAELGDLPNVRLCSPLSYRELVRRLRRARLVLTDSGGIQEEAPSFGKPVVILRDVTERPEGVEAGVAFLAGTQPERILDATSRLLTDEAAYRRMAFRASPYGDGRAAERIAAILAGEPYIPFDGRLAPSPRVGDWWLSQEPLPVMSAAALER
jgi:UDP-N-acetylglucosamine 2-epimerase (non-hydrolysing)